MEELLLFFKKPRKKKHKTHKILKLIIDFANLTQN